MRAILALLAIVGVCRAQAPKAEPERLFNQALAAQKRGDLQTAIAGYEQVLKIMPALVPARVNLAAAQLQLGRSEEAVANYRIALREEPKNAQLATMLGNALVTLGHYPEAISVLEPAEKIHPENLDLAFVLGEALIDANRAADGVTRIERVAKARNDVNAWMMSALTELKLARYSQAKDSADAALRADASAPGGYTLSGMTKAATGDTEGAVAAYRQALEINRDDFDANLRLGTLLLRDGQNSKAKLYLEHAVALNPGSLSAVFEIGQLALAEKHDSEAITDFEQVTRRAPDLLEPHVRLAVLYARAHRRDEAAREKQVVDRLMAQEQKQDPNALPDDLAPAKFSAPLPSH